MYDRTEWLKVKLVISRTVFLRDGTGFQYIHRSLLRPLDDVNEILLRTIRKIRNKKFKSKKYFIKRENKRTIYLNKYPDPPNVARYLISL